MPTSYAVTGATDSSYTGAANKFQLWAIKAGATTPLWIDYVSCHGVSDSADSLGLALETYTGAHAGMTDFTPILLEQSTATGKPASAVASGGAATAVYDSTGQTDGTTRTIKARWAVSTQSGGGLDIWLPPMKVIVAPVGYIGLFVQATVSATTLVFTVHFTEIA